MAAAVLEAMRRNRWTFVFRGICAIAFGFFAAEQERVALRVAAIGTNDAPNRP